MLVLHLIHGIITQRCLTSDVLRASWGQIIHLLLLVRRHCIHRAHYLLLRVGHYWGLMHLGEVSVDCSKGLSSSPSVLSLLKHAKI
jgi:hypothetical protein